MKMVKMLMKTVKVMMSRMSVSLTIGLAKSLSLPIKSFDVILLHGNLPEMI